LVSILLSALSMACVERRLSLDHLTTKQEYDARNVVAYASRHALCKKTTTTKQTSLVFHRRLWYLDYRYNFCSDKAFVHLERVTI
jgi:hypothetical protein